MSGNSTKNNFLEKVDSLGQSLSLLISKFDVISKILRKNFVFILIFSIFRALTLKHRIKSHLPSAGIIRSSPYSPR
jgi:hypothetical protein